MGGADRVFLGDIFAAGEEPIEGITKESLAAEMRKHGQENVCLIEDWEQLDKALEGYISKGDIIVCLGAGNITKYANELPAKLTKIM